MSEIQVNTSDLNDGSKGLKGAAGEIGGIHNQLSSIALSVGNQYDGQLSKAIEGIVGVANRTGTRLQSRAIDLGDELLSRAIGFESANEAGKSAMFDASSSYINFIQATPALGLISFFRKLKESATSIWNISGLAIGGLLSLIFVTNKLGIATPFDTSPKQVTSFGDLLKEEKNLKEKQEIQRQEWWNTNGLNQRDPSIVKAMEPYGNTFNACGATAMAMLINYSNFVGNKSDTSTDTASLVKWSGQQGNFKDSLLSFTELEYIASHQGFTLDSALQADGTSPITFENLKSQVKAGNPQIVLAKYGYDKTNNYVPSPNSKFDHFVIVTDITDNQVTIVNSHPGKYISSNTDVKPMRISTDEFKKIWTFDIDQSTGQGFGIKPK